MKGLKDYLDGLFETGVPREDLMRAIALSKESDDVLSRLNKKGYVTYALSEQQFNATRTLVSAFNAQFGNPPTTE